MSRLKEKYQKEISTQMMERFQYKNKMQVPRVTKVVLNMGVGEAIENARALDGAVNDMTVISGKSQ